MGTTSLPKILGFKGEFDVLNDCQSLRHEYVLDTLFFYSRHFVVFGILFALNTLLLFAIFEIGIKYLAYYTNYKQTLKNLLKI